MSYILFQSSTTKLLSGLTLGVLLLGMSASPASAQIGYGGMGDGITTTGSAEIPLQATHARLILKIQATAADMKAAVQKLRDRRTKAVDVLTQMKALESSVKVVRTSTGEEGGGASISRQMMRMQAMNGEPMEMPKLVGVNCTVTADWKLPEGDAELMLLFADRLQEKVKELKLTGEDDLENLPPEQAEMMAEMASQMMMYGEESAADLRIVFYAMPSEEQMQDARSKAMEEAKQKAAKIASAAGLELGKVVSLGEQDYDAFETRIYNSYGDSYQPASEAGEVISKSPDGLTKQVNVYMTYSIP